MRHRPGFFSIVLTMLTVGIAATTAMFSIVYGVLLQPLPFDRPDDLVLVGERVPEIAGSERFAYIDTPSAFLAWRQHATAFTGLAATQPNSFTLVDGGEPHLLHGARVSANFFDVLGVRAQLGRLLVESDETDTSRPMVITDGVWHSAFNADPAVIGRQVGISDRQARIVGVLPSDFRMAGGELGPMSAGQPTEYFLALNLRGNLTSVFSNFNYTVLGRLRPGVTLAQALAQLNVIQADLARTAPEKLSLYAELTTVRDYAVATARQQLWLLMAGVGAVLLMICVNLGGLWTTRIADRRREWAIRAALGAAPRQLAWQTLRESITVSLVGGALGIACAAAALRALLAAAPAGLARLDEVRVDWRVIGFGVLLAFLAGVTTGVVPALRLGYSDPQSDLKASGAATTPDRASLRSRQMLIGLQAALSTSLLIAVGLLGLSFYRLVSLPTGFAAEHALATDVMLNTYQDAELDRILRQLPAAIGSLPGVTNVGFTSHLPLEGETWIDSAGVPGRVYSAAERPRVNVRFISPGYFAAAGIPLAAGRDLSESDRPAGWPPKSSADEAAMTEAVVISSTTARMLWPGTNLRDVVGRKMVFNDQTTPIVVGVTADARDGTLVAAPPSVVYAPYWETLPSSVSLVVRSAVPITALAAPLRLAVWQVAPNAPIPRLRPLTALKAAAVAPQQYQLTLLLLFAAIALLLSGIGVYALVAHSVAQRRKELAIRAAIGARRADLWRLVLNQALIPVACGAMVGMSIALAARQLLASLLFEVSPANPLVLAAVAAAVFVATLIASARPAFRASRTDPIVALRSE
jgi:putative ABC transport system permease protein